MQQCVRGLSLFHLSIVFLFFSFLKKKWMDRWLTACVFLHCWFACCKRTSSILLFQQCRTHVDFILDKLEIALFPFWRRKFHAGFSCCSPPPNWQRNINDLSGFYPPSMKTIVESCLSASSCCCCCFSALVLNLSQRRDFFFVTSRDQMGHFQKVINLLAPFCFMKHENFIVYDGARCFP